MTQKKNTIQKDSSYLSHRVVKKIIDLKSQLWLNPKKQSIQSIQEVSLTKEDILEASRLWERFTPFFKKKFPTLEKIDLPLIESPLKRIARAEKALNERYQTTINNLYIKCDHTLPIAGSIKARGGFYEVLHFAETVALKEGLLQKEESYEKFASESFKNFFSQYTIGVGSTGNLGLSIGIMGAALGFKTEVYMSRDAKQWKKDLLREKGAVVHEFSGDFSEAITAGRKRTKENPKGYFVDDEDSKHLFIGYSTAAVHLKKQLEKQNIPVDQDHPLFLYLPCGVGGSPGGITFGVKHLLGDHVHCFFVEPTRCPSLLLGLVTGERHNISVKDVGIHHITEADGLAVGRPSQFATIVNEQLISGIYTIEDEKLFEMLALLKDEEDLFVEPSAASSLLGPKKVLTSDYVEKHGFKPEKITHIAWSTGGAFVPEKERRQFYARGKKA